MIETPNSGAGQPAPIDPSALTDALEGLQRLTSMFLAAQKVADLLAQHHSMLGHIGEVQNQRAAVKAQLASDEEAHQARLAEHQVEIDRALAKISELANTFANREAASLEKQRNLDAQIAEREKRVADLDAREAELTKKRDDLVRALNT